MRHGEELHSDTSVHLKPRRVSCTRAGMMAAAFMLATLSACDRASQAGADSDGSRIVLQSSDTHPFGTSESIAIVEDLEVLPNGSVWVLNSVEPFFVAFDAAGDVHQMHGRRGGGPDEFGAPAGFVAGGIDGEAWVFDGERHVMIRVSVPDITRAEIPFPRAAIPHGSVTGGMNLLSNLVRPARMGAELILPRRANLPESNVFSYWFSSWSADLVAFDPRTDVARDVVSLGEILGDPSGQWESIGGYPPFPLWYRLWAVCSDSEIRVHDRQRNELRGFTRDGTIRLVPVLELAYSPGDFLAWESCPSAAASR